MNSSPVSLHTTSIETPLGSMLAGGNEQGIWLLAFQDNTKDNDYDSMQLGESEVRLTPGSCKFFPRLIDELEEYFAGKRKEFGLPLVMSGTAFQNRVWQALLGIPYGETRTYKQQAKALGALAAIRAVAHANGQNRLAILVPCHRVIGVNGSLTGYGGGLWRKQFLLNLEKSIQPEFGWR